MSTMLRFQDNKLSSEFLTNEQLKKICPMAFHQTPTNPNVSDKYIQASTIDVINDLAKLGWYPVQAKQCRNKKGSSGIRSFHIVAFQNPNIKIVNVNDNGEEVVDTYPQIILTNSHDGFNSFKFMVGIFRLICSNGLVCGEQMINMSIRHINYNFEELRTIVANAIEQVPNIVNTMNSMRTYIPTEEQKIDLALEVLRIRKGLELNNPLEVPQYVIQDILTPVRKEDKKNDLWTIFNICQEKMIKGGFKAENNKQKLRKQKGITSIKKDLDFNQRLWQKAFAMCA